MAAAASSALVIPQTLRIMRTPVAAARRQELIRARNNLDLAQAEFHTALGVSMDSSFQPTDTLKELMPAVPILQDVEKLALTNRPDLKRIRSEQAAQRESVAMAKSSFGPRVNAFAGWDMDKISYEYPGVESKHVQAAAAFAADMLHDEKFVAQARAA